MMNNDKMKLEGKMGFRLLKLDPYSPGGKNH